VEEGGFREEGLEVSIEGLGPSKIPEVLFHFDNGGKLLHEFLEVAAALAGSAGDHEGSEGLEDAFCFALFLGLEDGFVGHNEEHKLGVFGVIPFALERRIFCGEGPVGGQILAALSVRVLEFGFCLAVGLALATGQDHYQCFLIIGTGDLAIYFAIFSINITLYILMAFLPLAFTPQAGSPRISSTLTIVPLTFDPPLIWHVSDMRVQSGPVHSSILFLLTDDCSVCVAGF
jgi:hypothetical protein